MRKIYLICLIGLMFLTPALVSAVTFNPNMIITDAELTNHKSMNMNAIKNFLIDKGSSLATYVDPQVRMYAYQVIYDSAMTYKINPKYVLTLLQKEQSLITDANPSSGQLNWATGYGCPDSGGCNDKYKGLAQQIDWGTGGIRYYLDNPNEFKYQVGQTFTIDSTSVTIANDATRSLYIYTPHLHGNENLFKLWNNWFSVDYPDGSLLQNIEDGGIWLVQNGKRRPFLNKLAFASRYSFDKVIKVKQSDLEKFETGRAISYANYSLLRVPTGETYLLVDDTLKHIENLEVFRTLGFNPEEVEDVAQTDVEGMVLGAKITVASAYPTGALLQDNTTGGVYYVEDGKKYPIWSKTLMNLYYSDKKLTAVSPDELLKYGTGLPVKFKDSELVKSKNSPVVYVISNGLKRAIASGEDFEELGYKWSNIITIEDKVLSLHGIGEVVVIEN